MGRTQRAAAGPGWNADHAVRGGEVAIFHWRIARGRGKGQHDMRFSKWGRAALAGLGTMLALGIAGFLVYFSQSHAPSPDAVAAMQSSNSVSVTETGSLVTLMPKDQPKAGLVFYPGARVQAAAYAGRLRPLAENGYAVFIVKFPLNLAIFGRG